MRKRDSDISQEIYHHTFLRDIVRGAVASLFRDLSQRNTITIISPERYLSSRYDTSLKDYFETVRSRRYSSKYNLNNSPLPRMKDLSGDISPSTRSLLTAIANARNEISRAILPSPRSGSPLREDGLMRDRDHFILGDIVSPENLSLLRYAPNGISQERDTCVAWSRELYEFWSI